MNARGWLWLPLVLSGAVACKGDALKAQAAADLSCQDEIETTNLGPYYEKASGCGRELSYYHDGKQKKWISPLDRAEFEMECPKAQLTAKQLDSLTVGVTGCGKKGVYKVVWGAGWVLDSVAGKEPAGTQEGQKKEEKSEEPPPAAAPAEGKSL